MPVAFGTAQECLFTAANLERGQTALIHAGAGGVGMAAIQLAHQAGATVLATASTDDKPERLKDFGRLEKVVYSASGCTLAPHEVYEGAEAVSEEGPVPLDLDSPYQISKVVGEFYAVYYHRQHAVPTVRARFQNVYGPGEILGAGRWRGTPATVWRNVTPTFVYRALKAGNSQPDGKSIFGGTAINTPPFRVATTDAQGRPLTIAYDGAAERTRTLTGPNQTVDTRFTGSEVFRIRLLPTSPQAQVRIPPQDVPGKIRMANVAPSASMRAAVSKTSSRAALISARLSAIHACTLWRLPSGTPGANSLCAA